MGIDQDNLPHANKYCNRLERWLQRPKIRPGNSSSCQNIQELPKKKKRGPKISGPTPQWPRNGARAGPPRLTMGPKRFLSRAPHGSHSGFFRLKPRLSTAAPYIETSLSKRRLQGQDAGVLEHGRHVGKCTHGAIVSTAAIIGRGILY
jgi:hypothetical protein